MKEFKYFLINIIMDSFTGLKDIDRKILLLLPDDDLIKICCLNKYLMNIVCDNIFFLRKLQISYPDTLTSTNIIQQKKYKSYYLNVMDYISKMEKDFNYFYVGGNPKNQFKIFKYVSGNNFELLFKSTQKGELNLIKEAVKRGVDIHVDGEYAIRLAAEAGYLDGVKYLVSLGANIHILDEDALMWACKNGHLEVVKYIVSLGANIHARKEYALKNACEGGHLDVVKYLVNLGADIHINDNELLRFACDHPEIVEYLKSL
jgi:hypothetical protein